ncbi:hypothetical protein Tco_0619245, partial [Tanacetum coccineum]
GRRVLKSNLTDESSLAVVDECQSQSKKQSINNQKFLDNDMLAIGRRVLKSNLTDESSLAVVDECQSQSKKQSINNQKFLDNDMLAIV